MKEPTFRMATKASLGHGVSMTPPPPLYPCQAPGCDQFSDTIACRRHLSMLPLDVQNTLTNAIATGEPGNYGAAMRDAMVIWTEEPS